jgi:hypothetical protein
MDITKVYLVSSEIEAEELVEDEEEQYAEQERTFDFPSTPEEDHTELLVDTTTTVKPSSVPVSYPKSTRDLSSLSYGTIGPASKITKRSTEK